MATKRCKNGHQYDSSIYGDNCPFCPSQSAASTGTMMNDNNFGYNDIKTQLNNGVGGGDMPTANIQKPTMPMGGQTKEPAQENTGGNTVIRRVGGDDNNKDNGRRIVGLVVTYDTKPNGEVFNIYEGRNMIGRSSTCDITIANDNNMSGQHLLILYRAVEGVYWASDNNSSNGTYVNGEFAGDKIRLKNYDVIVIGGTKFRFIAIPQE